MKREAFIVPSDVCYVAKGSDVGALGAYAGEWQVLASALSFDYLWNEVRVKGGAYGVGFRRTPEGFGRFYSFRDPAVGPTLERFDAAGSWLASFDPSEEEMEGYIVSTVASHDAPAKPRQVARRQDAQFFCEKPAGYRERLRAEKLATTPEKLRACSTALDEVAQRGRCRARFGGGIRRYRADVNEGCSQWGAIAAPLFTLWVREVFASSWCCANRRRYRVFEGLFDAHLARRACDTLRLALKAWRVARILIRLSTQGATMLRYE